MNGSRVKILPLVVSMGLISCVAAALMAWVCLFTEKPIAAAQQLKSNAALRQVLPAFDNQPASEPILLGQVKFFVARQNGKITGLAGEAVTPKGYSGNITVLAGIALDGTVTTVLVTQHAETPGLGAVICERIREKTLSGILSGETLTGLPPNRILDQYRGMKAEAGQSPWQVKKDGGTLDAITGATITSRAVADAVFTVAQTFAQHREELLKETPSCH